MSWSKIKRRIARRRANRKAEATPPPFPTMSTFLGIAAVMIVIWLLAYGLPHLLSAPDRSVPSNHIDTGVPK
jgi:hypothetical protein